MAFAAFTVLILIWFCLHLAAARWALLRLRNGGAHEIDGQFIRVENFPAFEARSGRTAAGMRFKGDAVVPRKTVTAGVLADGNLTLLEDAFVEGFADSFGDLEIGDGCMIAGRATSGSVMRLRQGASARVCSAPEITTELAVQPSETPKQSPASKSITLPSGAEQLDVKIERLSSDTWICHGDLLINGPVVLEANLVVNGAFSAGAGSRLNADLKANGVITLGTHSICRGRVVSGANMTLGTECRFEKILYCGGDLYLGEGVRGEAAGPVVAWGARKVFLGRGISVRGKLAAGEKVVALP